MTGMFIFYLVVAFWAGGFVGFAVAAMLSVGADADQPSPQNDPYGEWRRHS